MFRAEDPAIFLKSVTLTLDGHPPEILIALAVFDIDGAEVTRETQNNISYLTSFDDFGGSRTSDEHAELFDYEQMLTLTAEFDSVQEAVSAIQVSCKHHIG